MTIQPSFLLGAQQPVGLWRGCAPVMLALGLGLSGVLGAGAVQAQTQNQNLPNAGSLLRDQSPAERPLPPAALPQPQASQAPAEDAAARVEVQRFVLEGVSLIPQEDLLKFLTPLQGKAMSLAELQGAANQIAEAYRQRGWVVRVWLPEQEIKDGVMRIAVLEGNYTVNGTATTTADVAAKAITGLSLTGTDAANYTVNGTATTTADVSAKALTGSVTASNKTYDGTTAATLATRTLSGVVAGDTVSYSGGTATFDTKNVGTGKTVTATGLSLTGTDAANYTVNGTATTTADVATKALTVTANDANKTQGQTLVFAGNEFSSTGLAAGESIGSVNLASAGTAPGAATGAYAINISNATGGSFSVSNYSVTYRNGQLNVVAPTSPTPTPPPSCWQTGTCTPIVQPTCATTGGCGASTSTATQAAPANALFCYAGDVQPETAESGSKFCWALGPDGWRDCGVVDVDVSSIGKGGAGAN